MQQKLNAYKKDGAMAMKHMWYVILVFSVIQIIVSAAVAQKNATAAGGYKSATFAAIWAMFLVIIQTILGAQIVFYGRATALQVGFLIGVSAMLCQLFFVLMVIFFVLGTEATTSNYATAPPDKAYGAFAFFNMIIYFVWSIILSVHRDSVVEKDPTQQYSPASTTTMNPVQQQPNHHADVRVNNDDDEI